MLNAKQKLFCEEYINCNYNATDAYEKVYGVSHDSAKTLGARQLRKPEIKEYVNSMRDQILEDMMIDRVRITTELAKIAFNYFEDVPYKDRLKAFELLNKTGALGESKETIVIKLED